jgi:hypothetical protein
MAIKPIKIDFTNVKEPSAYNPKHIEPGEYLGKIKAVIEKKSNDGDPMLVYEVTLDDVPGASYPYYVKINFDTEKSQAWKIRQLFMAAGITVPKKALNVNVEKVVGKRVGVEIEEDEYQGRMKGAVRRFILASEVSGPQDTEADEDDEDEEDAPPPPRKRAAAKKKVAPPVEDDEDDEDEEDEEPTPPKRTRTKKKATPPPADDDEDEDEIDLDEL